MDIGSFQLVLMLCIATILPLLVLVVAQKSSITLAGCNTTCGDLEVPYPFGVTAQCAYNESFFINCTNMTYDGPYEPFLGSDIPVINISTDHGKLHIMNKKAQNCYDASGLIDSESVNPRLWVTEFMTISSTDNIFVVIGCDTNAWLSGYQPKTQKNFWSGCMSFCNDITQVPNGSCSGNGCCQTSFDKGISSANFTLRSFYNHSQILDFDNCGYAFVVDKNFELNFSSASFKSLRDVETIPMVLDWAIGSDTCAMTKKKYGGTACQANNSKCVDSENGAGYICKCSDGYEGNPYLPGGCQDVDECKPQEKHNCVFPKKCYNTEGGYECICQQKTSGPDCGSTAKSRIPVTIGIVFAVLILLLAISILSLWAFTKWKLMKVRENFYKKNGGVLLQQKLSQKDGSSTSIARIFSVDELEKATNQFSPKREIGRGGFGTVYKGTLSGGRTVAIKKSKILDQNQVEQFINEVVVLSRIDHRNVVRLIGCCLETEVPLLVYEFVSNGTLFDHIYDKNKALNLTWKIRLRIAAETARVLSYLHSEASMQIVHRDIKSTNVLLDDNYTAKVADFGASRLVPIDEEELTTMVQGTLGYLDPEYLRTNQLTTKSDVYSFGVLLVELLTAQKAISFNRSEEHRYLAAYFLSALKDERLMNVIDDCTKDGDVKQVMEVAHIAKLCLKLNGEERPTMKEVALQLEGLTVREQHFGVENENNFQETKYLLHRASHRSAYMDSVLEIWQPADDGR